MKIATIRQNGQAALVVGERLFMISLALERHNLLTRPALTVLDLLADWSRNLDLLVKLNEHLLSDEQGIPLSESELDAPIPHPGKMIFAAANYNAHVQHFESKEAAPKHLIDKTKVDPYMFLKLPDSVTGPYSPIILPHGYERIDWEVELALVIGHEGSRIPAKDAMKHVAGFVVLNDVTARDRAMRGDWPTLASDWLLSKSFATFCPIGPFLVPKEFAGDCHDLTARLWLNGELYQNFNTADMIFTPEEQIEWASSVTTLHPGDVISTGTGPGNGIATGRWLQQGDVIEAEITGLGRQKTPIIAEQQ